MSSRRENASWTDAQGQYLAFIHAYVVLHGRAPSEADMQAFFRVTPPSVHRMVVELERKGFIRRYPGVARSIELTVHPDALPKLIPFAQATKSRGRTSATEH